MRVPPCMIRSLSLALGVVLLALGGACASNKDNVIADEQSGQVDFKTKSETYHGQSESEEILERDAQEIREEQGVRQPEPAPDPTDAPAPDNAPLSVRDDGRPSWWFSSPRETSSKVSLCAEALAPDMRRAREAAIDAGRTRLRADLDLPADEPLPDVHVVRAWVWPLPNTQAGTNRYAGYVMVSAPVRQ